MAARVWSMADVACIVNGLAITEFVDGDAISITLDEDDIVVTQGQNGAVSFAFRPNSVAEVTLNILQGSPDNKTLNDLIDSVLGARRGSLSIDVSDGRSNNANETLFSSSAAQCMKRPDMNFATETGPVAWTFKAFVDVFNFGGNELA